MFPTFFRHPVFKILFLGWLLAVGTGVYNIGFLALDDYTNVIGAMIPAQLQIPLGEWIYEGVHPPLPRVLTSFMARLLLDAGVTDPLWQLRLSLGTLAALNFLACAWSLVGILEDEKESTLFWSSVLFSFYFLSPLIFSRPMIESLCMPFLMVSSCFASRYWKRQSLLDLQLALAVLAAGSLFRFQVGACALAVFLLPALRHRISHVFGLLLVGVVCIVLTGFVDVALGLGFHGSLLRYAVYNQNAGEWHGSSPFYTFLLLFVGLSLPPTFFSRYKGIIWRTTYAPLVPVLLYFASFVTVHSAFPHKEERFMIPSIPLFLILLSPLLAYFSEKRATWRLIYFSAVNGLLLVLVVTQIPQINTIALVRAVDSANSVDIVASVGDSIGIFPGAYGIRTKRVGIREVSLADVARIYPWPCQEPLIVRFDKVDSLNQTILREKFTKRLEFPPGLLERVLVQTNPHRNVRRGHLEAWLPERCPSPFSFAD